MLGIYAYFDKKDNSIAYVGKDSNIDKNKRKTSHMISSNYNSQPFNRILQSNPNRYTYQVLVWNVKDQDTLNALEIQYILQLNPKFNYTDGGDGCVGLKHSDKTKKRISDALKGINNPMYHKKHSKETKRKMSTNHWDCGGVNNPMYGKHHSDKTCKRISESRKGKYKGRNHSRSIYTLWDSEFVGFNKGDMLKDGNEKGLRPRKCFKLKYGGHIIHCGGFFEFTSIEIINEIIKGDVGL